MAEIEYTIEINPITNYTIELNEQGPQGARGYDGVGISSIDETSSQGLVDTYTITLDDGRTSNFDVTNGFSPTATVTKSGTVATITITDENGTTTAEVYDGNGSIDDVRLNEVSVVSDGVAEIYVDNTYDSSSTAPISGMGVADAGFITGIESSDVTTALGYTPANEDLSNLSATGQDIIDSKANVDLSNLSSTGQAVLGNKLNRQQITNCILEAPQHINLKLASSVLTLKAGSKVIVPNGFDGTTPKFDEVTIKNDIVFSTSGTASYTTLFIINTSSNVFNYSNMSYIISGSSPSQTTNGTIWYDTANNVIKVRSSGSWITNNYSLPVGLITLDSGTPTEIYQVFNGFGFIGSIVFADKGIKGLIPNGRNADGSLNNTEFTTSSISLRDISTTVAAISTMLFVNNNGLNYSSSLVYKPDENLCYQDGDLRYLAYCGRVTFDTNKKITSLIYNSELNINELIDGKTHHVANGTIVEGATSPSSTRITYDLSTFLPNTNDEYMALITGSIATGTTSNNIGALLLNTSLLGSASVRIAQVKTYSSSANYNGGSVWLPIGADRKINVEPATSNTGTFNLYIRAYRRIGGNY